MFRIRRGAFVMLIGVLGAALLSSAAPAAQDKGKEEKKKQDNDPFPFPNFPPGGDFAKQAEAMRQQMERMQEMYRKQMEDMRRQFPGGFPGGNFPPGFRGDFFGQANNRLGAGIETPSPVLVDQLELPKNQGIVLNEVKKDSAASKAGLRSHDILLELDGKAVPSKTREFLKTLNDIKTGQAVDAVVLRKGKKETVKGLTLPEAPAALPGFPGGPGGFPGGLPGAPGVPAPPALPAPPPLPPPPNAVGVQQATQTLTRGADGSFTGTYSSGNQNITVSGKVADGKAILTQIEVRDGGRTSKYGSVEDVPASIRENVRGLIRLAEDRRLRDKD